MDYVSTIKKLADKFGIQIEYDSSNNFSENKNYEDYIK